MTKVPETPLDTKALREALHKWGSESLSDGEVSVLIDAYEERDRLLGLVALVAENERLVTALRRCAKAADPWEVEAAAEAARSALRPYEETR